MPKKRRATDLAQAASRNPVGSKGVAEVADYDDGSGDEDPGIYYPATPRVIDFAAAARQPDPVRRGKVIDERESDAEGKVMTAKRIRARARRAFKSGKKLDPGVAAQLWKPIEEWDMEELARGRPRAADGSFRGAKPGYISREMHETAMDTFKQMVRSELNGHTVDALTIFSQVLNNNDVDIKGKPVVTWATKMETAKFLVEHVIGKAVQPTTSDISAKLQLILGAAMVNPAEVDMPAELEGYRPAHIGHRVEQVDLDNDEDDFEEAEVVEW